MDKSFSIPKELKTVVPAINRAWVRIIERWDDSDDPDIKKLIWCDSVYRVLAYAHTPDDVGAYLVASRNCGPSWLPHDQSEDFSVLLYFDEQPIRGEPAPGFTDGYKYEANIDPQDAGLLRWLTWD